MDRKSIGAFIAALRKANGMTQKDLAELLHVSDKTVSRWEVGDGAPDLALIPLIAEIFGVACDELLRGERRPDAAANETTPPRRKAPAVAAGAHPHPLPVCQYCRGYGLCAGSAADVRAGRHEAELRLPRLFPTPNFTKGENRP